MRMRGTWAAAVLVMALGGAAAARADNAPAPAPTVVYTDQTAQSSAVVTLQGPKGEATTQAFTRVLRVELAQGVFVVHWGGTAVTLLPQQFVTSLTINRRADTRPAEESR